MVLCIFVYLFWYTGTAIIEFNEEAAECNNGIMNLNEEQLHWSKKVY